jgi:hypothetical protein
VPAPKSCRKYPSVLFSSSSSTNHHHLCLRPLLLDRWGARDSTLGRNEFILFGMMLQCRFLPRFFRACSTRDAAFSHASLTQSFSPSPSSTASTCSTNSRQTPVATRRAKTCWRQSKKTNHSAGTRAFFQARTCAMDLEILKSGS